MVALCALRQLVCGTHELFQQMLLAPAALGLLAPMAANGTELNIDGVNRYARRPRSKSPSITQFSDCASHRVGPTRLLSTGGALRLRGGYPAGTFRGNAREPLDESRCLLKRLPGPDHRMVTGMTPPADEGV